MDSPPQPPPAISKLRLMCSYGGHIIPHPHTKSLFYSGGDTRLITIPTPAAATATTTAAATNNLTLSSLISHLSTALKITTPFTLKYQLPNHNLDSLISLSTDEDVLIMLDEHQNNRTSSRVRLFVFPIRPSSSQPELKATTTQLNHPKTETWFVDALKNAKIVQFEGNANNGGGLCGAESMVLETSSSFGSTSSSVSLSNLGVKGGLMEDNGVGIVDNKVKLSTSEGISSDNGMGTVVSQEPQIGTYQDAVGSVAAVENKVSLTQFESESKIHDPPQIGFEMHKPVPVSGFPLSLQYDQPQQLQFIYTGTPHYVPQNPSGAVPMSSYYVMNSPMSQQQVFYQTNQPQPIYYVPVGQAYNVPMQSGLANTATVACNRPPLHPNSAMNPAQMAYNVAATVAVPELASQVYRTIPRTSSPVNVPHNENHQQAGGLQMNQQAQSSCAASMDSGHYGKEDDDDPVHAQIYKSQPPPPTLPSQYRTMTKATAIMLSEAMAQLHTDNIKQQLPRISHHNDHSLQ